MAKKILTSGFMFKCSTFENSMNYVAISRTLLNDRRNIPLRFTSPINIKKPNIKIKLPYNRQEETWSQ